MDLKAYESFLQFRKRITGPENEIPSRRAFFKDRVTSYTILVHRFLT